MRDARVSIHDSQEREGLVVTNLEEKKRRDRGKDKAPKEALQRLQFVVAYDMADWREWCACVRREDCLMKTRAPPPQQQQQQQGSAATAEVSAPMQQTHPSLLCVQHGFA